MEKQILKKCLHFAAPAVLLLLAACSNLSTQTDHPLRAGDMPAVTTTELNSQGVANAQAPKDLWERIRAGFAMPDLHGRLVDQQVQRYLQHPESIQRMTRRSSLYIFHIVEQVEMRNMPTELALLPFVESAFNPQAVSRARAAGMWQFMPATGREFNLVQNAQRDERRDVIDSTAAALDYLQQLHDRFGDWHLALAAYNWGPGNVSRALAANDEAGLGERYIDLNMPDETRNYVPRLQALKNMVAQPERYGNLLPVIENTPYFDSVEIRRDIDLKVAAHMANVQSEDLRALNPSHHGPIIRAADTPRILLPWDSATTFRERMKIAADLPLTHWQLWQAPQAALLQTIADETHSDLQQLRQINGLPPHAQVEKDRVLLVAARTDGVKTAKMRVAQDPQQARIHVQRQLVTVNRGDTLIGLARRYGVPVKTLADWNKIKPNTQVRSGQKLVFYLPQENLQSAGRTPRPASIVVQRGDSLSVLASQYGVSTRQLASWNKISPNARLKIGQKLQLR